MEWGVWNERIRPNERFAWGIHTKANQKNSSSRYKTSNSKKATQNGNCGFKRSDSFSFHFFFSRRRKFRFNSIIVKFVYYVLKKKNRTKFQVKNYSSGRTNSILTSFSSMISCQFLRLYSNRKKIIAVLSLHCTSMSMLFMVAFFFFPLAITIIK